MGEHQTECMDEHNVYTIGITEIVLVVWIYHQ